MPSFKRYIGIDYSGAKKPTSSLKGLRVYAATCANEPTEVSPPPSPRKYWTRRGLAQWLVDTLRESEPTIIGIDHAFSFPLAYFERHRLPQDWHAFLNDFCIHWPTDGDDIRVDLVRKGLHGNGAKRMGDAHWRRVTDVASGGAKSPFHFDVQGSVAKSTHSGLPWLKYIRDQRGRAVHFWPFDGWEVPAGVHVIAEVYPSLWRGRYPVEGRTPDQQDAYTACSWLQDADQSQTLGHHLEPVLTPEVITTARFEGWIIGSLPTGANPRHRSARKSDD